MTRRPAEFMLLAGLLAAAWGSAATARGAEMAYPLAIAAGGDGALYVADRGVLGKGPPGIWKIAGGKREWLFEAQQKFKTPLYAVRCVAIDREGRVVAGDTGTREIYRFGAEGRPEPLTKGANAGIGMPMAIAFAPDGEIFVADLEIQRIVRVPAAGGEAQEFVEFPACRGLAFDAQGRLWGVSAVSAKSGKPQLARIAADGTIEPVVQGLFNLPHHLALDPDGNAYVADNYENAIWKVPPQGDPVKLAQGEPLQGPVGVAWQGDRLLVADPKAAAIFAVAADGKVSPLE